MTRQPLIFSLMIVLATAMTPVNATLADTVRIEDADPAVSYTSDTWGQFGDVRASGGSVAATFQENATASISFNGTGLRWIGFRCACTAGIANLYLDGTFIDTVDTYAPTSEPQQADLYVLSDLPAGEHTFTIEVTGNFGGNQDSGYVVVDAFEITAADGVSTTLVEDTDPAVTYSTQSWLTIFDGRGSGGSVAATYRPGARATVSFDGTGVTWLGFRCACAAGIANVYVDGVYADTVDTYAATSDPQPGAIYTVSGLAQGNHSMTVEVTGDYNRDGDSAYVIIDAFDVETGGSGGGEEEDTTPPTVDITSPTTKTWSGTVTVSADASDDTGVTRVTFSLVPYPLNGQPPECTNSGFSGADTTAPYSVTWDTTTGSDCSYQLIATAYDAADNRAYDAFMVAIENNTDPFEVSIVKPADGETVTGIVYFKVETSYYANMITFQLDDTILRSSTATEFPWNSTSVADGTHTLSVYAEDIARNPATAEVTFTVDNRTDDDTTPPTVTVTSPPAGAVVSGDNITIRAEAADDTAVAGVTFLVDGTALPTGEWLPPYEKRWDTTTVADGEHTITAMARDAAGNTTTSDPVTVTVDSSVQTDLNPPEVWFFTPADGDTVSGVVTINVHGYDAVALESVEVLVDGTRIGTEAVPGGLFSINWESFTVNDGSHALAMVARDESGNSASLTVTVNVANNGGGEETRLEEDDPAITYTGNWDPGGGSFFTAGKQTELRFPKEGGTATLDFTGTGVDWIGTRCPCEGGIANVYVDGTLMATVDTYAEVTDYHAELYSVSGLEDGNHTLTIEATGEHNPAGRSASINVDAFDVKPGYGGGGEEEDTTPPTVTITSPADGATVSGAITLTADASDDTAVAGVHFRLNGNPTGEDTEAPYMLDWDSSAVADGSHTVTAVARDTAGNTTISEPVAVTVSNGNTNVDTTPPAVRIVEPAYEAILDGTATVTAEASDNVGVASVRFAIMHQQALGYDPEAPYSVDWDTSDFNSGSLLQLMAIADDEAGNESKTIIPVIIMHEGEPSPVTVTTPQNGAIVSGTLLISAQVNDLGPLSGVIFRLDGKYLQEDTEAPYEATWNSTTASEGEHTLTVIAVGIDGHPRHISQATTVTVDNQPDPTTVTISSPADAATVFGTVTVSAQVLENFEVAGVQFTLDGNPLGTEDTEPPYEVVWDTTGTEDSAPGTSYTLTAIARDVAGNLATSPAVDVVVDNTTDHTPPTVVITSPVDQSVVSGTVTVSADASDNTSVDRVVFQLFPYPSTDRPPPCSNTPVLGTDTTAPYAVSWDTGIGNCGYRIQATAYDAAGNSATTMISVGTHNDTEPPQVTILEPAEGAVVSGTTTMRVDASDNVWIDRIVFEVDDTTIRASTLSEFSWNSTTVPDGTHTLRVEVRDVSGYVTQATPVTFTVDNQTDNDTTPPTVTITAPVEGALESGNYVTLSADATDDTAIAAVKWYVDGMALETGDGDTLAPYTRNWNSTLVADGEHTVTAVAKDAAGNTTTSDPVTVIIDNTTPPAITMTAPAPRSTVSGTVRIAADASDNHAVTRVEFRVDGDRIAVDYDAPFAVDWDTTEVADGSHQLNAVAYDEPGNSASHAYDVVVDNGTTSESSPP